MTENHYSMLVLWSEDDEAFLAHVVELPGCIAHGETREMAVQNGLIAIENWIETAEELKREIPAPLDLTAFEKYECSRECYPASGSRSEELDPLRKPGSRSTHRGHPIDRRNLPSA